MIVQERIVEDSFLYNIATMLESLYYHSVVMNSCENPVESHFEIGRRIGVTGTPAIITQTGLLLPGYIPANELIGIIE